MIFEVENENDVDEDVEVANYNDKYDPNEEVNFVVLSLRNLFLLILVAIIVHNLISVNVNVDDMHCPS